MTKGVIPVNKTAVKDDAAQLIMQHKVHHLVVVGMYTVCAEGYLLMLTFGVSRWTGKGISRYCLIVGCGTRNNPRRTGLAV